MHKIDGYKINDTTRIEQGMMNENDARRWNGNIKELFETANDGKSGIDSKQNACNS